MKKICFIVLVFCSGCGCVLSQVPPQYVYSGPGCEAPLPDYLPLVTVTDNCKLSSLIQNPVAGYMLGPQEMITTVTIRATDATGNSSQVAFTVALIDTVPPVIILGEALTSADYDKMDALLTQAERIIRSKIWQPDATFPYYKLGITDLADSVFYVVREIKR